MLLVRRLPVHYFHEIFEPRNARNMLDALDGDLPQVIGRHTSLHDHNSVSDVNLEFAVSVVVPPTEAAQYSLEKLTIVFC